MKRKTNKYYVLLLLVLLFAAPGIAAYIVYQNPSWLSAAKVNKGDLLTPSILCKAFDGEKKWRMVYWTPTTCTTSCMKQLDTLARVRLALGRRLYQVDQWLILGENAAPLSSEAKTTLKELNFKVGYLPEAEIKARGALFSQAKIFLADPDNYLILSYSSPANPDDVYKDLKLLLNTTENKNG